MLNENDMKKKISTLVAASAFLLAPALSHAQSVPANTHHGFYVGGSVGTSNITGDANDIAIPPLTYTQNRDHFAYKLYGGYQFNQYLAIEAGYIDLGADKVQFNNGRENKLTAKGGFFDLIGSYPITNKFSVDAKLGYTLLDNRSQETGASIDGINSQDSYDNSGVKGHVTFGAGARYNITQHIQVRADYDHYAAASNGNNVAIKSDMFSLGLQYRF